MILRILTSDPMLIEELLVTRVNKTSGKIELAGNCFIKPLQTYESSRSMIGVPELLEFMIEVTRDIASGLLAAWIYDMIKNRNIRAEIDGEELPPSKETIEEIIILKNIPEKLKKSKQLLDEYIQESIEYQKSFESATKRIKHEMKNYDSSWKTPNLLPYNEGEILESQLLAANACPNLITSKILRETACRLIPYGCVSAKCFKYDSKNQKYYIILDTGTSDFFGNMACLIFAKFEQEFGSLLLGPYDYGLDCQELISKFWGLALIYHDFGFKTNNEALLYPHFRFSSLREIAEPHARLLSYNARQFFLFHEFGHIVDESLNSNLNAQESEFSADFFAFTAIREMAFTYYRLGVIKSPDAIDLAIIGSILALESMDFIESTFKGLEFVRGGQKKSFELPKSSHPNTKSRIENLLKTFPESAVHKLLNNNLYKCMINTFKEYSELIRGGARPSPEYWELQELILQQHKRQVQNKEL